MSIGGNDIPFGEVVAIFGKAGMTQPVGSPCRDYYTAKGFNELAQRIRSVGKLIGTVLDGIHQRSPRATVLLVGYPVLMPESGTGCWPRVPVADSDAPWLRDMLKYMNRVMADQAGEHRATYVDTYTSSIGHDFCQDPGTAWMEGPIPTSLTAPLHPNALGAQNQADQILATLHRIAGVGQERRDRA